MRVAEQISEQDSYVTPESVMRLISQLRIGDFIDQQSYEILWTGLELYRVQNRGMRG